MRLATHKKLPLRVLVCLTTYTYTQHFYCDRHHPEGVTNRVLCCCCRVPPACQGGEIRGKTSGWAPSQLIESACGGDCRASSGAGKAALVPMFPLAASV